MYIIEPVVFFFALAHMNTILWFIGEHVCLLESWPDQSLVPERREILFMHAAYIIKEKKTLD